MKKDCGKRTSIGRHIAGSVCTVLFLLHTLPLEASSLGVFVSIAPQKYFVRKIGGNLVSVSNLVPAGADPHTFEPKPRQMVELSKCELYFAVGVDFEKAWLKKIAAANPRMRIIHTDEGIAKLPMTDPHQHEGDRRRPGKKPAQHDGAPDPHIWLAPGPVKVQAAHIFKAIAEADPKNRLQYAAGYDAFMKELDALDGELRALFAGRRGKEFMVFHHAWAYFAEAYGLEQVPVESGGKEPKAAQLQALIRRARDRGIKAVFVQPQMSVKSAEMVAREIGGAVVYADPLAENWDANLREVARKFSAALQ